METGWNDANKKIGENLLDGKCDAGSTSKVFDVVIDPLTDFKVSDHSNEPSSPQQSFNLSSLHLHSVSEGTPLEDLSSKSCSSSARTRSLPPEEIKEPISLPSSPARAGRTLRDLLDTKLWSSNVSLSSGSGTGSLKDRSGSSGGGGGSNHHRLVIPEVHRFGYNPPCAGSPHDLASCPVTLSSAVQKSFHQTERLSERKPGNIDVRYDTLRTLSQASSALALTETLIGPLKISPVPQEILNKVVSNMERKASLSSMNNGHSSGSQENYNVQIPSAMASNPPFSLDQSAPSYTLTGIVGNQSFEHGRLLSSMPSILEPDIHRAYKTYAGNQNVLSSVDVEKINTCVKKENVHMESCGDRRSSRVIAVPVGMSDNGPVEVYKEVHPYPASSITTVVERCSYIGQTQLNTRPPSGMSKRKKSSQKQRHMHRSENYPSQSSLASGSSAASDCTIVSKNSSELTPVSHSHASSSKASLNDSRSDCGVSISKPLLSAAILQMRHALESVSAASDNRSDKSSVGLEVASNFSDTSSNLSTLSDLSGYEDEYIRIKRIVSDAVIPPEEYKKMLSKTINKPTMSKPVPSVDYEKILRDVNAQKEDLEIQLHRLSIQVQNAVREKELYQQQLELMNTKITETNQKQYFEVLKQRANLEGQLEMLKQELENSVYEKSQLQLKVSECMKESELFKGEALAAKEAESHMNARLCKYEEANKELEEKLRISSEEVQKLRSDCEKTKKDLSLTSDKNINLELALDSLQAIESQLTVEIKGLRGRVSQLQEECQAKTNFQHQAEAAANKASAELKASQNSCVWYQEQLQLAQTARSSTQQELLEARASIARLTNDKESLDLKVQTLVREAEDGQARAFREKASLVAHLEALQADMAEREALVSQLERDRGSDTKLMEDRRQRLEQDRHRIHQLRLDLSDAERQVDTLKDDLKHKCILISKYEKELKELRTSDAVNQEVLGEKDARIQNLEHALSESKLLLNNEQQDLKQKILIVSTLKEEKANLEVSFAAANNEKKEVDDAIIKVREDMTKLSSNFYRMKHDIAVKDRQLEDVKKDLESMKLQKETLERKCDALEVKLKEDDEKKKLTTEAESLKNQVKENAEDRDKLKKELLELTKSFKTIEIEKKSLYEAVQLREEQIQNMQGSLENYREEILKKDEELYVLHEQTCSLEKSYSELRQNWDSLRDENLALRQEAEAFTEHEQSQKRELSELKESIQKERKLKQSLEKKMEKFIKMQEEGHQKLEREKAELETITRATSQQLQSMKEEKIKISEALAKLEKDCTKSQKEFIIISEAKKECERRLKETLAELDGTRQVSSENAAKLQTSEGKVESLMKEIREITHKLTSQQSENLAQTTELHVQLRNKEEEIMKVRKIITDRDSYVSNLEQDKKKLSEQLSSLSSEMSHLKKITENKVLPMESKSSEQVKDVSSKKAGKATDILQKELFVLQTKYTEAEAKLKEITRQKENLQNSVKSTKKESLLMKAKMKDYESLKVKCKDLENKDFNTLQNRCRELESQLTLADGKIASLEATVKDKEVMISTLELKDREVSQLISGLDDEKRDLNCKISTLEEICQKSQDDIAKFQSQLKTAENDRDEWMVKYESLRDIIPERDTSTQRAVQLGMSSQTFSSSQETLALSPLEQNSSINSVHSDTGFFSDLSQASISDGSQFDKTMADLQAQVSLTSKALQNKEKQISDLQHQISLLRVSELNGMAPPESLDDTADTVPGHIHRQQIQNLLEKFKQLQVPKESSPTTHTSKSEVMRGEIETLALKVKNLESAVTTKENELEKAQAKLTEFQEKHRRYESNVRLLTRKLKEHMKGRKSAEKEMQNQAEEHQRLMEEQHKRYSVLRSRCLELEGHRESLEGQVTSLETEVEEIRTALKCSLKEVEEHRSHNLALQKDIGKLQEATKTIDSLRSEAAKLEEKVTEREKLLKEQEHELKTVQEQLKENQAAAKALNSGLKEKISEVDFLQQKYQEAEVKCEDIRIQLQSKEEDYFKMECILKDTVNGKSQLSSLLKASEEDHRLLVIQVESLREQNCKVSEEGQHTKLQFEEALAKNKALENNIKVIEGELKAAKEELNLAVESQTNREAAHQISIKQLQDSITKSREEVAALSSQLGQVQRERVSYQTQATELRIALHSALAQLKMFQAAEEAREEEASTIQSEIGVIPSPSPLDLAALTELMERSVRPIRSDAPLNSLQSCLSSLKAEVATLQTQLQSKRKELSDESPMDEVGTDVMSVEDLQSPSDSLAGTEIV